MSLHLCVLAGGGAVRDHQHEAGRRAGRLADGCGVEACAEREHHLMRAHVGGGGGRGGGGKGIGRVRMGKTTFQGSRRYHLEGIGSIRIAPVKFTLMKLSWLGLVKIRENKKSINDT